MKRIAATSSCSPCLACSLRYAFDSFTVSDIRIDGLSRIAPGTVFTYLSIEKGDVLTPDRAEQAIRALYKTGFFNDVQLVAPGRHPGRDGEGASADLQDRAARQQGPQGRGSAQGPQGHRPGRGRSVRSAQARRNPERAHAPVLQPRQVQRLGEDLGRQPRPQPRRGRDQRRRRQGRDRSSTSTSSATRRSRTRK